MNVHTRKPKRDDLFKLDGAAAVLHGDDAPSAEQARQIMANAMRDFVENDEPESVADALVKANIGNNEVINAAVNETLAKITPRNGFPENTTGAIITADNDCPGAMCSELDPSNPDSLNYANDGVWVIPAQSEIEIGAMADGSILIYEPPGPGTQSEGERITVAPRNAVAFARRVLWAAGFKGVLIAVGNGSYVDLNDGDVASDVDDGGQ